MVGDTGTLLLGKQGQNNTSQKVQLIIEEHMIKKNVDDSKSKRATIKVDSKITKEVKKPGRPSHRVEGIKYVRINPAIPVTLKKEMDIYIKSDSQTEFSTIDRFIEAAIRDLLKKK